MDAHPFPQGTTKIIRFEHDDGEYQLRVVLWARKAAGGGKSGTYAQAAVATAQQGERRMAMSASVMMKTIRPAMEVYAATLQKNVMQSLEQQTSNVVARLEGVERAVRAENQLTRDAITGGMTSLQRPHESSVRQLADVTETNARQLAGVTADVFKALTVRPWSALGSGGRRTGGWWGSWVCGCEWLDTSS